MAQTIKARIRTMLPAVLQAGVGIAVTKLGLIYQIALDYTQLAQLTTFDPSQKLAAVQDAGDGSWNTVTIAGLRAVSTTPVTHAMSPYVPSLTDSVLFVDTSGGTVEIDLLAAAARTSLPLEIYDVTGNANSNNITIKPSGSEDIDGYLNASPLVVTASYGGFKLYPRTSGYKIAA